MKTIWYPIPDIAVESNSIELGDEGKYRIHNIGKYFRCNDGWDIKAVNADKTDLHLTDVSVDNGDLVFHTNPVNERTNELIEVVGIKDEAYIATHIHVVIVPKKQSNEGQSPTSVVRNRGLFHDNLDEHKKFNDRLDALENKECSIKTQWYPIADLYVESGSFKGGDEAKHIVKDIGKYLKNGEGWKITANNLDSTNLHIVCVEIEDGDLIFHTNPVTEKTIDRINLEAGKDGQYVSTCIHIIIEPKKLFNKGPSPASAQGDQGNPPGIQGTYGTTKYDLESDNPGVQIDKTIHKNGDITYTIKT